MSEYATIARPYARAAFEYADTVSALDAWESTLLASKLIIEDKQAVALLTDPEISSDRKAEFVCAVLGNQVDAHMRNFIKLLASKRRLLALSSVADQFVELKAEKEKTVKVRVSSVYELTSDYKTKLTNALKLRLQREVELECELDKSLIGGAVIRANDWVVDGSVRGRLQRLAATLVE